MRPGPASGNNAARINALLGNYTLPAAWGGDLELPADPVTSLTSTVYSAAQFETAAATNGTRITIGGSWTGDADIDATSDLDVVNPGNYVIDGDINCSSASARSRIRWSGGGFGGGGWMTWRAIDDLIFDDVVIFGRIDLHIHAGVRSCSRVALINSDVDLRGGNAGDPDFTWESLPDYQAPLSRHSDHIIANCRIWNDNNSPTRLQSTDRLVYLENWATGGARGFRAGGVDQAYIAGRAAKPCVMANGNWFLSYLPTGQTHGLENATIEHCHTYAFQTYSFHNLAVPCTGTVSNCEHHSSGGGVGNPFAVGPFTDGGDNPAIIEWDGSAPSDVGYGTGR